MSLFDLTVTLSFSADDINEADQKSDELLDRLEDEGFLVGTAAVEPSLAIGVESAL